MTSAVLSQGSLPTLTRERERPFELGHFRERSVQVSITNKRLHLRKRDRPRTTCGAAGTGRSRSCRARWSDPVPVRKCVRGPETNQAAPSGAQHKLRGTERVHSPALFLGPLPTQASTKKGGNRFRPRPLRRFNIRRVALRGPCAPRGVPGVPGARYSRPRRVRSNRDHRLR